MVNAVAVNVLGRNVHTIKKNAEAVVFASKKTWLEVNADTRKYMVMSRDKDVVRSRSIKTDNRSFERVEEFKYWEQH